MGGKNTHIWSDWWGGGGARGGLLHPYLDLPLLSLYLYLLLLFNFIHSCCTTQILSLWFVQWYKILHSVKDQCSIQLGFTLLNKAFVFNLMQNLVPLHSWPFTICILLLHTKIIQWVISSWKTLHFNTMLKISYTSVQKHASCKHVFRP